MKHIKSIKRLTSHVGIPLDFSDKLYYVSLAMGLLTMATLSLGLFNTEILIARARESYVGQSLDLVFWILDPIFFHLLTFFSVLFVMYVIASHERKVSNVFRLLFRVGVGLVFFFVTAYALESLVIKKVFYHPRPPIKTVEPILTPALEDFLSSAKTYALETIGFEVSSEEMNDHAWGDVPSGFTTRQVILFMILMLLVERLSRVEYQTKLIKFLLCANIFALIWTPLSRVYTGDHSMFGIGMGVGTGIFVFWLVTIPLFVLVNRGEPKRFLYEFPIAGMTYLLILYCYSGMPTSNEGGSLAEPSILLLAALGFLILYGALILIVEIMFSRRAVH